MTAVEKRMKRTENPGNDPADRNVRVAADIADMLGWINHFEREKPRSQRRTIAQIVDPMLREEVIELYEPLVDQVKKVAKALGLGTPPGSVVPRSPSRK